MTFRSHTFWGSGLFTGSDQLVQLTGGHVKEQELVKNWEDGVISLKGAGIYFLSGIKKLHFAYSGFYDKAAEWSSVLKTLLPESNPDPVMLPGFLMNVHDYLNLHVRGKALEPFSLLLVVYYDKG